MNINLLKKRRLEIIKLAKKYGANNIRIFGSVARNSSNLDSDIDFLVNMDSDFLKRIALIQELEILLGRKIDVVNEKSLHWYISKNVIEEAVPL